MAPLLTAASPIPSHAFAAMGAVVIGVAQLLLKKGTRRHRVAGWSWVSLMAYVAISSFFISETRMWGAYSPIHLLSLWTIFSLCVAVYMARAGHITQHKYWMGSLYVLALIVTGLFTLWPGRIMHEVLFGG